MIRILLIYSDYDIDEVDRKSKAISIENENIVYHFPEEIAVEFFLEKENIDKVFFTDTISIKNKEIFSKKPYNGKKMS